MLDIKLVDKITKGREHIFLEHLQILVILVSELRTLNYDLLVYLREKFAISL